MNEYQDKEHPIYFIFDSKNPKELIFYVIIIAIGILLDHFDIVSTQKAIAGAILSVIGIYVIKSLLYGTCDKK